MATKAQIKKMDNAAAKERLAACKEEIKEARASLQAYNKENKIKRGEDLSDDNSKKGKGWKKLSKALNTLVEEKDALTERIKETKTGGAGRASKYTYPDDVVTAEQKKKYREKMRKEAKNAGKAEKKAKKAKPVKAEKTENKADKEEEVKKPAAKKKAAPAKKKPAKKAEETKTEADD